MSGAILRRKRQSLDKGWLRYNSGQAVLVDKTPLPTQGSGLEGFRRHEHLYICTYQWGGVLFDFMGWTDANDAGRGFLRNEWAVYADSGPLGWSVIG